VPLHVAVQSGDADTVAALLGRGSKVPDLVTVARRQQLSGPIAVWPTGRTGLWGSWRMSHGRMHWIQAQGGGSTHQSNGDAWLLQVAVKYKNNLGYTPLHLAAKLGNLPVCEVLLGAGARADLKDQVRCCTVMQPCACSHTSIGMLRPSLLALEGCPLLPSGAVWMVKGVFPSPCSVASCQQTWCPALATTTSCWSCSARRRRKREARAPAPWAACRRRWPRSGRHQPHPRPTLRSAQV
jgi:Ankyrin repeats (many copies)